MNISAAVKLSLQDPHEIINSSAQTELGRKLTKSEFLLLSQKFSLGTVSESIEKVQFFLLFESALIYFL